MDNATQRGKILAYCKEHGSITVREAFEKLHINSPTKRISELRYAGYVVNTVDEVRIKDGGEKVRYKRYYIFKPYDNFITINEGDKVRFVPGTIKCGNYTDDEKLEETVTGTVIYINHEHRYFTAEYEINKSKYKESFKFADLGQAVTKLG